ncbi:MAG TPA: ABC transporter permease [Bacillus bacterium]|uniref:Sugar ABC transporter permease n=1 Tax=Siminovitchia fordii TaxID=254759 RepID=A0ABQ4K608_9BACI|nr:ABC transporter permease [Siminovitchia fordii]GIN20598.1 sugar ABC transporter permease [Siminovitchia fordii]HBZ10797.1 ABC transporter permease [Bacillus sp. (in: firmicutes)]
MEKSLKKRPLSVLQSINKWGTIIAIVVLLAFFTVIMPDIFLTSSNIINILRSISIVTIIAIGLTVSLSVDGFDLSIGSSATLSSSLIVSFFVWYNLPAGIAIPLAIVLTLIVALINVLLIVKIKIPDLFATLSTMFIFEGVAMTYTGGGSISEGMPRLDGSPTEGKLPVVFDKMGETPWIIIIMILVVMIVHVFLNHTKHGRYMYMIGGNIEAARLSGIPVNRYKTLAYVISTLFAALGGIILASYLGSAQINSGAGYLMPAVAAAFIGSSFAGNGKPNAIGTFIGAALVGILENGLVMMSVPYYSLNIVKGMVLALALASTYYNRK